jgi:hypothetical protein
MPLACVVLMVGILAPATGCDKSKPEPSPESPILPPGTPALDLTGKPQLIFQVFGERANPRVLPLVAVVNGVIKPIGLTADGWRRLDSLYFRPGTKYPIYVDDVAEGEIEIERGMWGDGGRATYPLPGCARLKPIATAKLTFTRPHDDKAVEVLAASVPLVKHPPFTGKIPTEAEIMKLGRDFGHAVGKAAGMDEPEMDALDFNARAVITGATSAPTLLVSFLDPEGGDAGPGAGNTSHIFALGDKIGTAYEPTWRHVTSGDPKTVEFQRMIDHLDADGDGIDEMIVLAWRFGADNDLVVLSFKAGRWHEVLRVKEKWCLDAAKNNK